MQPYFALFEVTNLSGDPCDNHIETGSTIMEEAYMTEIQLRRTVDRTNQEEGKQLSDGDEIMTKDDVKISKFSEEAMGLGKDVYDEEGTVSIVLEKELKYLGNNAALFCAF
jgi:hypothetical protein